MTSKQRFLAALSRKQPDRLPVTTHHIMQSFLKKYMGGIDNDQFFEHFGLDPIRWLTVYKPDTTKGEYHDPLHIPGYLEPHRIVTDQWRIYPHRIDHPKYETIRYDFVTPKKTLTTVLQSNEHTTWVVERLVKEKKDIEIIGEFAPCPKCDIDEVNRQAAAYGERGLVRGLIPFFEVYGQSGCWQDASVLFGIEALIMATYEDPEWVHAFLKILQRRKAVFLETMAGAHYDLLEHGGGDASTTIISPQIFGDFVAPYDAPLIDLAHKAGQRVVYHTCGGMMPILEQIAAMKTDAMETFTPASMGGDTDLVEAKRRIGDKVCMIGGLDQFHFFKDCSAEATRKEVRRCFEAAGEGGGFILSPSDHFFDADVLLLEAFADEARKCVYR